MTKDNLKYWYRGISNVAIVLLLTIEYGYVWLKKINILLLRPFENKGNFLIYAIYIILSVFVIRTFDGFKMGVNRISHIIISQWVSMVIVNVIAFLENFLMVGYINKLIYIIPAFIAGSSSISHNFGGNIFPY